MVSVGEGGKDIIAVDVEALRWLGMVGILMARLSDEKRGGESANYWSDLLCWNYGNGRPCRRAFVRIPCRFIRNYYYSRTKERCRLQREGIYSFSFEYLLV
jgi:hypothetical protein